MSKGGTFPTQYAIQDRNQFPGLIGHSGTTDTSDIRRVVVTDSGAMAVDIVSGDTINIGTVNLGTITSVGSIGTLSGVGTITNVGTLRSIIVDPTGAEMDLFKEGDNYAIGGDHGLSILGLSDGTPQKYAFLRIEGVDDDGETPLTKGAASTEAYNMVYNGATFDRMRGNIADGVLVNLGTNNDVTVGSVGAIGQVHNAGTVQINPTPIPSTLTFGTQGTAGGSFFATISAASGAGTYHYVSGVDVVMESGTADVRVLAGTAIQGTGVLVAGKFTPGGGISKNFNPAFNAGTNSEITYHFVGAGTAFINVNYWKG